eukprot:91199-Amphidinium_carterae.1
MPVDVTAWQLGCKLSLRCEEDYCHSDAGQFCSLQQGEASKRNIMVTQEQWTCQNTPTQPLCIDIARLSCLLRVLLRKKKSTQRN